MVWAFNAGKSAARGELLQVIAQRTGLSASQFIKLRIEYADAYDDGLRAGESQ